MMPKKQQEKTISVPGCLALGFLAITPGILFFVAVTYQIQWLAYTVTILILLATLLFFLAVLTPHSQKIKEVCHSLCFLFGLALLFDILFGRRK